MTKLELSQASVLSEALAQRGQAVAEALPVLQLPTDHPRTAVTHFERAVCRFELDKELRDRLQAVCQQAETTWPATLLSGFMLLLHRYTQQGDLLVGSSFASGEWGANSSLLVRADLSAVQTVGELQEQVQQAVERGQRAADDHDPQQGLPSVPVPVAFEIGATTRFACAEDACELHVQIEETQTGLVGQITYNAKLWEMSTISRMAGHFARILLGIAQQPDADLQDIPMMSEAETEQLLVQWNRTESDYPEQSLQEIFENVVAQTPDAIAVVYEKESLTYAELNRHANRLASRLTQLGVGPDVLVGLCAERSLEMVVGLLAIVKAGGAYVPFDANYPDERLAVMFEDSQVHVLLTQQALRERIPAGDLTTVLLDDVLVEAGEATNGSANGNEFTPSHATLDHLAYITYTSGSTGKPKGVCVPQRGVVRLVKGADYVRFAANEVFLQYASISFDAATFEIWGALLNGAKLVLCPAGQLSLDQLGDVLQTYEVTTLWLTAGLFQQMVELNLESLGSVRQLLAGGDVLSVPHVKKVLARWPHMRFTNGYGPTESTTFAATYSLTAATERTGGSLPIGRPIANTTLYVLDPNRQPVPIGVPGELYIGGDGLARGYLNRDELTAERFVPHPFGEAGERLYRTGDLVRYLADGNVEFLGRIDNQVKIRGFRIELGEVEAVLSSHPDVKSCVAVAHTSEAGEKRLVAYVVLKHEEMSADEHRLAEIRQHIQTKLPAYAVPSLLQPVPTLPLTANGKVDVRALPAPEFSQFVADEERVAPRNPVEELLLTLFEQTLGLEKVGLATNFFDLGGHSLLAVRLIARIREAFGVEIKLDVLFEAPSVAQLATHVRAAQQGGVAENRSPIVRRERQGDVPASFAQQQMWIVDRLQNGASSYHLPFALQISGTLHIDALERSLQAIVNRHEVLRTRFVETDGQLMQRIDALVTVQLPVLDFTGAANESPKQSAEHWMMHAAQQPFDLANDHLISFALLKISDWEHVLYFNMHHIVGDGWSMSIFAEELTVLYKSFVTGESAPLAELPVQYADFAQWEREHVQVETMDAHLAYWREQLSGELPLLQLPLDRPRSLASTRRGALHLSCVPKAVASELRQLSKREGVTLYMTLLAAFNTWLHRISGQDDLLVGSPSANRTQSEVDRLIGYFVNTLVLRNDLSGEPTFRELLRRVRQVVIDAHVHQEVPFETLVEELQPERSATLTPFFQVMFQLTPSWTFELADAEVQSRELFNGFAKFDLYVALAEADDELAMRIEYDTALFDHQTVERMAGHFRQVLAGIVANPDARLWEMPLLSAEEMELVLHTWNDTKTDYPQQSIHELFTAQVAQTPDAVAVVYGQDSLTYAELNRHANRLARHLQQKGVGRDVRVGICAERSLEMVVGLLAIVKAGGAYVPFDANYPDERLRYLFEDAQVTVLLVQQALLERLPVRETPTLLLDDVLHETPDEANAVPHFENVAVSCTIDDLAYINYTSGSTGKPKGVCIPQRGVVRLVKGTEYISFSRDEVFLQYAPISFDAATLEIWGALLNGAKLVICPAGQLSLEALGDVLQTYGVTTMWLTAGLFQQMVEHHVDSLGSLRQLLAGGDVLSVPHVKKVLQRCPHLSLTNGYGPTESTTFATTYTLRAAGQVTGSLPIGRPIANTSIYVLDSHMQPVPIGVPGELYIGGDGLARGYWNRPDLTEERFVPHPFGTPGARLYKTGDLVRSLPDGNVEFLGRIDNQVKIRGFRIELGEIETELMKQSSVQEAFVIAHEYAPGDKRLIAYFVPASDVELSASDLRTTLKAALPDYMVPALFVVLEAFPLTPNGKINRAALPIPERGQLEADKPFVAPRNALETQVERIFAEVLRMEKVSVDDPFFELGGHSLLATQVISRVRDAFGLTLPLTVIFEASTVAKLAARLEMELEQGMQSGAHVPTPQATIQSTREDGTLLLSFAQQRLWFLDQYEPMSDVYNVPAGLRLQGTLHVAALEQAIGQIIERHESLRTVFSSDPERAEQFILPVQPFTLPLVDLSDLPQTEREAQVTQLLTEERTWTFDLAQGPLFRARLLHLQPAEHVLLLNLHHIITDGWSMNVFAEELRALYAAFVEGRPSPLAPLSVQYADHARWQRDLWQGDALHQQLCYWKDNLSGALPVLQLPTDRPRPKKQTFHGAYQAFTLPKSLHHQLKQWSQAEEATLFMTLLTAFKTLMYRYTGQTDLLVGAPIAGRNRREIEGLIGFFVNTLVLRTDLSGEPSFRELVRRVRETALGAYSHQDVPFEKLVEELQPERDLSHSPLFQVMFTLQDDLLQDVELTGLEVETIQPERAVSKFDLTLFMSETTDGLRCGIEYNTDLFDRSTIERMIAHLTTLLESIVEQADQSIAKLPLLTAQERVQLLTEWNDTTVPFPENICLHQLFEQQAQRTPDLVAAVYGDEELTYRELDERANQLARHLQTLGVSPDVPVGVCIERSLELIVGMIGVLKAGGAFLPLDPEAPADRIRQVVSDAGAPVVLSQASLRAELPLDVATFVFVDVDSDVISRYETTAPPSQVTPDHLISIYYTSGSTGKPKGVANLHRGWLNRMCWMQRYHQLQPGETVLHKTTVTFDATGIEVFWPLMAGGRIALLEPKLHRDSRAIVDALIRYEVAAVLFVPSMLNLVLEEITPADQVRLGSLRLVSSAGEALRPETVKAFQDKLGHISTLHNTWGATEVSICSTNYTCSPDDADETDVITLGKPFDNNRVYILDEHLQPVPVGVAGDIYLAGIGLARYYLNNPEKTAEAFVTNPFAPQERLYRTGDRGAYRADGAIRFLGREDNQVKIRGVRVELGEVENVLNHHEDVKEAVVIAHEYKPGDKRLVGYVVSNGDVDVQPSDLRAFLKSKLPDYMVPSMIAVLETLPLNANGKVDRKALPIPELDLSEAQATYVAPRNPLEAQVADIWSTVLQVEQVGVNDNFFDLGGHSLLATQVVSRIRRAFHIALPVAELFALPTIASLAERVQLALADGGHAQDLPIVPVPRTGEIALSFAQQRLYFLDQLEPGSTNYNVPVMLRLRGVLDVAALKRSLQEIVQRHESLRTTFAEKDGIATQVIAEQQVLELPPFDLSQVADAEREVALQQLVVHEASRPFDLFQGPLFRPCLIRLQADEHVLFLNSHHIITDGWSMGVFTQELADLYGAFVQGQPSPLTPLSIQYADFAIWQRHWLAGDVLQTQLGYWKQQLGGTLPVLNLAPGQERPAELTQHGELHHFDIPAELVAAIHSFAEQAGATLFMTLLTAYKALLLRHSGQSDLLVGMPIAGRNRSEIEHLIGFFVNTLVLRTDLSGNPTFREALQRVKTVALEAFTHQDVPYDKLVDELQADRDKGLFQTMFQLLHESEPVAMHGLQVDTAEVHNGTAKFDLTFTIVDHGDGTMAATFEYNRDLYQASLIERLSKQFLKLLETAMQEPNQHLNSLKLGSEPHGFDEDELDELF